MKLPTGLGEYTDEELIAELKYRGVLPEAGDGE